MIIKTQKDEITPYLTDSSGMRSSHAEIVYVPQTYEEAAQALNTCSKNGLSVAISGAGTGTTGARLPYGGAVISTEKLNLVQNVNIAGETISVQCGVSIVEIDNALVPLGYFYPPDPTEFNSFIGGNISTNASGARSFKYGQSRGYIERIKVAMTDGRVIDIPRGSYLADGRTFDFPFSFTIPSYETPDIKNAAGYYSKNNMDLIDLFIGSEGTLGLILEADLKIIKMKGRVFAGFAFFNKITSALEFVKKIKTESNKNRRSPHGMGINALALEFFDENAVKLLSGKYTNLPSGHEAVVFFEEEVTADREDRYLEEWDSILQEYGVLAGDVWTADTPQKEKELKEIRHGIPSIVNEIVARTGFAKAGTDIAVPDEHFDEMFWYYRNTLKASGIEHLIFGHIGDNHLHVNMLPKSDKEYEIVKEIYFDFVKKSLSLGGTVSAEHGIGKTKHKFLAEMFGKESINEMIRVKKLFDPALVLGRGNIFPQEMLK